MVGDWIGAIEGGTIWQIVSGQMGCMSIELEQIACIFPFTHRHMQSALTSLVIETNNKAMADRIRTTNFSLRCFGSTLAMPRSFFSNVISDS
jgi:hypothetical protein